MTLRSYYIIPFFISAFCSADTTKAPGHSVIKDEDIVNNAGSIILPTGKATIKAKDKDVYILFMGNLNEFGNQAGPFEITYEAAKNRLIFTHISRNYHIVSASIQEYTQIWKGSGTITWQIEKDNMIIFTPAQTSYNNHQSNNKIKWQKTNTPNVTDQNILIADNLTIENKTVQIAARNKNVNITLKKAVRIKGNNATLILNVAKGKTITFHVDKELIVSNNGSLPFTITRIGDGRVKWEVHS